MRNPLYVCLSVKLFNCIVFERSFLGLKIHLVNGLQFSVETWLQGLEDLEWNIGNIGIIVGKVLV